MDFDISKNRQYLSNCFLLLIPIIIWNLVFIPYLPDTYSPAVFNNNIPAFIAKSETILRVIVFALPLTMKLSLQTKTQKIGFSIYSLGLAFYFLSWVFQIYYSRSVWSMNLFGFTAPAYTTILFFIGIGLIGKSTFMKISNMSIIYISISVLFVVFHSMHAYIVFQRL